MKFTIGRLQKEDLRQGFLESLENLTVVDLTPKEAKTVYLNLDKNSVVFVARTEGGIVVGTAMLFFTQRFIHGGGRVGHLEDVAVRKGFERQGIGTALIRSIIEEARQRGCYKVILDCGEHNVIFYEKCGFNKRAIEMRMDL